MPSEQRYFCPFFPSTRPPILFVKLILAHKLKSSRKRRQRSGTFPSFHLNHPIRVLTISHPLQGSRTAISPPYRRTSSSWAAHITCFNALVTLNWLERFILSTSVTPSSSFTPSFREDCSSGHQNATLQSFFNLGCLLCLSSLVIFERNSFFKWL